MNATQIPALLAETAAAVNAYSSGEDKSLAQCLIGEARHAVRQARPVTAHVRINRARALVGLDAQ